jgi:hypothetical protein
MRGWFIVILCIVPSLAIEVPTRQQISSFYDDFVKDYRIPALNHLRDDVVFDVRPASPLLPLTGVWNGRSGVDDFIYIFHRDFQTTSLVPEIVFVTPVEAFVRVVWRGSWIKSGKAFENVQFHHWTLHGNKASRVNITSLEFDKIVAARVLPEEEFVFEGIRMALEERDRSHLPFHPQAKVRVSTLGIFPFPEGQEMDFATFVQQVLAVMDIPKITFRVLGSEKSSAPDTCKVAVEYTYSSVQLPKTVERPAKHIWKNVKAISIYEVIPVDGRGHPNSIEQNVNVTNEAETEKVATVENVSILWENGATVETTVAESKEDKNQQEEERSKKTKQLKEERAFVPKFQVRRLDYSIVETGELEVEGETVRDCHHPYLGVTVDVHAAIKKKAKKDAQRINFEQ